MSDDEKLIEEMGDAIDRMIINEGGGTSQDFARAALAVVRERGTLLPFDATDGRAWGIGEHPAIPQKPCFFVEILGSDDAIALGEIMLAPEPPA